MTSSHRAYLKLFYTFSFWGLMLVTLVLSLMPVEQLPKALNFWDKAQHALGFAALGFLGLCAYAQRKAALAAGLLFYGLAIESTQALSGWRQGDWADWLADALGVACAYLLWHGLLRLFKQRY